MSRNSGQYGFFRIDSGKQLIFCVWIDELRVDQSYLRLKSREREWELAYKCHVFDLNMLVTEKIGN